MHDLCRARATPGCLSVGSRKQPWSAKVSVIALSSMVRLAPAARSSPPSVARIPYWLSPSPAYQGTIISGGSWRSADSSGPVFFVTFSRFDLDAFKAGEIEAWCRGENFPLIGKVPFDPLAIHPVREGIPVTQACTSPAAQAIQTMAANLEQELNHVGNQR